MEWCGERMGRGGRREDWSEACEWRWWAAETVPGGTSAMGMTLVIWEPVEVVMIEWPSPNGFPFRNVSMRDSPPCAVPNVLGSSSTSVAELSYPYGSGCGSFWGGAGGSRAASRAG